MCFIVMCLFLSTYSSLLLANGMFIYLEVSKFVLEFLDVCPIFLHFSVLVDVFIGIYSRGFISHCCKAKAKRDVPR